MTKSDIGEPTVEVRAEQPYVAIPIKVTLREWGRANALLGEIFAWLGQKGVAQKTRFYTVTA